MNSKLLEQLNLVIEAATQARTIVLENMAKHAEQERNRAKKKRESAPNLCAEREESGEEGEKGTLPPAPPLKGKGEEEGKGEREGEEEERAGARLSPHRSSCQPKTPPPSPTIEEILAHWEKHKFHSDPQDYYLMNTRRGWVDKAGVPIVSWRAVANSWEKTYRKLHEPKPEPPKPQSAIPPPNFTRADWILCEERCARFKDGRCICGVRVPPDKRIPRPAPPEECEHFEKGADYRLNVYGK